jgi:type VI secretion system protein ImpH
MATPNRQPGTGVDPPAAELKRLLEREPYAVDFFQAVQLLERMYPGREPVGYFVPPAQEVVRFSVYNRLTFPASEIQSMTWAPDATPVMAVNFMGVTGPAGVLPHVYTLLLVERRFARDRRLQEFLDLFHHRMISLYYRVWRKYRVTASFASGNHRPTWYLSDLAGIGTAGLANRQEVDDRSLLYFAGILALQPRSAVAFEHFLQEYFGVAVEVHQFAGAWYDLPADAQCELIDKEDAPRRLGLGAVAGDQIWDHSSKARIRIGPLSLARYRDFLPGTRTHRTLRALARFYSGGQIDFDVQLVLARDQVPTYELGAEDEGQLPLGLCSWAKTGDFEHDPDDAILFLGEESWA